MADLQLKIAGVFTNPNRFSAVPPGALIEAANTVIDSPSILEPRRGFRRDGDALTGGATDIRRVFNYGGTLLAHYGGTLSYRDGDAWIAYDGTFGETDYRVRDAQANRNLYLTTDDGVRVLDDVEGEWRRAGIPRPLDGVGALSGVSGFLAADTAVGYRAILYRTDANDNEKKSAPSQRLIVPNDAAGDRDVSLTFYLPAGLDDSYGMRIYRSVATAAAADEPSDDMQLALEFSLTDADISTGSVTVIDSTPEELRGAYLYTSPSQETIANQNDEPPFAADICLFNQHLVYINVRSKHRLHLQLIGAGPGGLTFVEDNGTTTDESPIITGLADTSDLHEGMKAKAATGIPDTARILSIDSATQVTLTEDATASGARDIEFQDIIEIAGTEYFAATATDLAEHEFEATIDDTPATNIELTSLSLIFAVNQDPTGESVYGYYTTGYNDLPGLMQFEEREIGGAAFTAVSTAGDSWAPALTSALSSSNSAAANTVMFSKPGEPEAVPLKNKQKAGDDTLRRGLALSDAVYLLGDQVWRMTGTSVDNFSIDIHDATVKLLAPETAVVFNNRIYAVTTAGVVEISATGAEIISNPIQDDLDRITSDLFTQFPDTAFACGYDTASRYCLWVPDDVSDESPTKAWVYNPQTRAWTSWTRPACAAVVNRSNDKLQIADFDLGYLYQERKSFARTDYADEEFARTIISVDGDEITVDDTADIEAGFLLVQDFRESLVLEVVDGTTVIVEDEFDWDADTATFYQPIVSRVRWAPFDGGNPAILHVWKEAGIVFENADFDELTAEFSTDLIPVTSEVTLHAKDNGGGWGVFPFGDAAWGLPVRGEQVVRTLIPKNHRRSHWLNVALEFSGVYGNYRLAGIGVFSDSSSTRVK